MCDSEHCPPPPPSLQIFVKDSQGGTDTTMIQYIGIFGGLIDSTNMKEFKRVSFISTCPSSISVDNNLSLFDYISLGCDLQYMSIKYHHTVTLWC